MTVRTAHRGGRPLSTWADVANRLRTGGGIAPATNRSEPGSYAAGTKAAFRCSDGLRERTIPLRTLFVEVASRGRRHRLCGMFRYLSATTSRQFILKVIAVARPVSPFASGAVLVRGVNHHPRGFDLRRVAERRREDAGLPAERPESSVGAAASRSHAGFRPGRSDAVDAGGVMICRVRYHRRRASDPVVSAPCRRCRTCLSGTSPDAMTLSAGMREARFAPLGRSRWRRDPGSAISVVPVMASKTFTCEPPPLRAPRQQNDTARPHAVRHRCIETASRVRFASAG